jgi:hypothetical protein
MIRRGQGREAWRLVAHEGMSYSNTYKPPELASAHVLYRDMIYRRGCSVYLDDDFLLLIAASHVALMRTTASTSCLLPASSLSRKHRQSLPVFRLFSFSCSRRTARKFRRKFESVDLRGLASLCAVVVWEGSVATVVHAAVKCS